jgi:hypothetical protein
MQTELEDDYPALNIQILGINQIGSDAGNETICSGRDIPWLQDIAGIDVWASWSVTYPDVIILDTDNVKVGTFNVTANDLAISENYNTLRQMLVDAATVPEPTQTLLYVSALATLALLRRW